MNHIFQSTKVILLALALSIGISYVSAWTAPTVTPPNGNVAAPLNVSSAAQIKTGSLRIQGSLGVGTINPDYMNTTKGYVKVGADTDGEYGYLWGNPNNIWNLYKPNGNNNLKLYSYANGGRTVMDFYADTGNVSVGGSLTANGITSNGDVCTSTKCLNSVGGTSWTEVSGKPAGFADGVDNTGPSGLGTSFIPLVDSDCTNPWHCVCPPGAVQVGQQRPPENSIEVPVCSYLQ